VEHPDGSGPRPPTLPSPVATFGLGALTIGRPRGRFRRSRHGPLYTLQTVFAADHGCVPGTREAVNGVVWMVLWSLFVVVTIKYVGLVMRADNDGEGGMMALVALVRRLRDRTGIPAFGLLIALGIFGASLFFGDAMVTPAISVLSAVEDLKVVSPSLGSLVVPIALAVLIALFAVQRFGTGTVGRYFRPVMVCGSSPSRSRPIPCWQEALFLTLARHFANSVEYFSLPLERTVVMGGQIVV
jgi:KUP system potassium uptake protein